MKKTIWNLIGKSNLSENDKKNLFLLVMTEIYGVIGYLLWLIIGRQLFDNRLDWLLCFIGFSAFFPGFLLAIFYVYNHEGLRRETSEQEEDED
ncbi:MAG: hypothetical protein K6A14_04280 [Erysipelotrichaceae bacterium]|nr:hypothetical protein [Erysipelotrichaceae bacterium]